jgi:type IV fimbrial biogenesis protein FimT
MVMKKDSGFTLIEMMVVLAIAGIVLGIGIPKLSVFFQGSRMTTNTNALVAAFQIAKSEAIKRQGSVTVCRSANQTSCDLDAANTWEDGFIVFFDPNANRVVDGGTDIILRINAGAENRLNTGTGAGDVTIRGDTTLNNEHQYITFTSRGHPKNGAALQSAIYVICDSRLIKSVTVNGVPKTAARGVVLSVSGKVRSTRDGNKLTTCLRS